MARTLAGEPSADGFHMPAEFAPHDGCWMIWPERTDNWRLGAKPAQAAFAAVAEAVAETEAMTVCVSPAHSPTPAARSPRVRVVEMTSNDSWMRDVGPTFVVDGKGGLRGVDWRFNAWGGLEAGSTFRGIRTTRSRKGFWRSNASTATARQSCSKAARSTWTAKARC